MDGQSGLDGGNTSRSSKRDLGARTEWLKFGTALLILLGMVIGFLISKSVTEPALAKENEQLREQIGGLKSERSRLDGQVQLSVESRQRHTAELATKDSTIDSLSRQIIGINAEMGNGREREEQAKKKIEHAEKRAEDGIKFAGEAAKNLNRIDVLLAECADFIRSESSQLAPVRAEIENLNDVEAKFDQALRLSEWASGDDPLAPLISQFFSLGMRSSNQSHRDSAERKKREIEAATAINKLSVLEKRISEIREEINNNLRLP